MALRPILIIPDDRLRTVAAPVDQITPEILKQIDDMFETMYDAPGIGLAAPQIGVLNRVIVVDAGERKRSDERKKAEAERDSLTESEDLEIGEPEEPVRDPIAMINPEILASSEEISVYEEGCLSIPDYYEEIERPAVCQLRYIDVDGKTVEREIDGLLSTVVQHEIDHLDGKLFIDYLSRLKRERVTKKFAKMARRAAE